MERLTLEQARDRVAAQMPAARTVDAVDWTDPAREALRVVVTIARVSDDVERWAVMGIALALLGYQAHLDYEAGRGEALNAEVRP